MIVFNDKKVFRYRCLNNFGAEIVTDGRQFDISLIKYLDESIGEDSPHVWVTRLLGDETDTLQPFPGAKIARVSSWEEVQTYLNVINCIEKDAEYSSIGR